ncbi:MAG: NUDIX domain-containing protein [Gaiellaceae bacterium]
MAELHGWRLCPRCGSELELEELRQASCPSCGSQYYANSAPTVGALCTDEQGRLMLVRRAVEPEKGKWDTPGGFLDEGEDPLAALRRELLEETGLTVEPLEFLGAWIDWYGDRAEAQAVLSLNWTAQVTSGDAQPADDISEIRWFGPDELPPPEECAFSIVAEIVTAWRTRR